MNILICMIYIYQSFLSFYICIFDKIHYIRFNESCIHCLVFEAKMVEDKPFSSIFPKAPISQRCCCCILNIKAFEASNANLDKCNVKFTNVKYFNFIIHPMYPYGFIKYICKHNVLITFSI